MSTTLIYGSPCGGKSTLVHELHERGDLVLDFDQVHAALSGLDPYDHHDSITPFVVTAMEVVKRRLQAEKDTPAWVIACVPTRAERFEFSSFTDNVRLARLVAELGREQVSRIWLQRFSGADEGQTCP